MPWNLASFIRHPGKLLGGNEISAGAEEWVEVEGRDRKWERPGSRQSEQLVKGPWIPKSMWDVQWRCLGCSLWLSTNTLWYHYQNNNKNNNPVSENYAFCGCTASVKSLAFLTKGKGFLQTCFPSVNSLEKQSQRTERLSCRLGCWYHLYFPVMAEYRFY